MHFSRRLTTCTIEVILSNIVSFRSIKYNTCYHLNLKVQKLNMYSNVYLLNQLQLKRENFQFKQNATTGTLCVASLRIRCDQNLSKSDTSATDVKYGAFYNLTSNISISFKIIILYMRNECLLWFEQPLLTTIVTSTFFIDH